MAIEIDAILALLSQVEGGVLRLGMCRHAVTRMVWARITLGVPCPHPAPCLHILFAETIQILPPLIPVA
jgi:hypothetical protein